MRQERPIGYGANATKRVVFAEGLLSGGTHMYNIKHTVVRLGGAGLLATALTFSLAGCTSSSSTSTTAQESEQAVVSDTKANDAEESASLASNTEAVVTTANVTTTGVIDTTDLFTERDLTQTADTSDATTIALESGQDVQITKEGVYVLTGEASNVTVRVEVEDTEKVQLVLNGVSIANDDAPAIYVVSADKVFVTTVEGTTNPLEVSGTFVADGDTNTDAVVFSKDDLVLNGLGTLVVSSTENGITSKDDLKVTGGAYQITSAADALEANDSIAIADGSFVIDTQKDGLHAENDEDDTQGSVYICGGTYNITAADDGIQATTYLQLDGGTFTIEASEALEATYVQVNDGTVSINATDDGINASTKSASVGTPTIEITGGEVAVTMGAGDTDALDANGNLIISGGTIDINAQFAFDFDGQVSFTGGTVTVNGEQVSEITSSMMGGGFGGPRDMGGEMGMPEGMYGGQMMGGPGSGGRQG